jgi:hypothetical protein
MSASGIPADYVPGFVCHLGTCNITEWGYVHYQPSVPGNVLFLVLIDALGLAQLILGIYHKTGLVCVAMIFGLASESSGYIARILLHYNPFSKVYFMWYLICLTLGPVFIAAAIYICLGRIVVVYGEEISRIKPRSYTVFFMGCDFIALCVQTVGGAIAASAPITNRTMVLYPAHFLLLDSFSSRLLHSTVLLTDTAPSWNTYPRRRSVLSGCKFVCLLNVQSRISVASP